jgi:hypothetical protein
MFARACLGLSLLLAVALPARGQEKLGVRLWADIEVVGIFRIMADDLLLDTEEEHRGAGSEKIVIKPSTWRLGKADAKTLIKLRPLDGKKVLAQGKGLFIPETAYFLGVPVQTIRLERELRNFALTELKE